MYTLARCDKRCYLDHVRYSLSHSACPFLFVACRLVPLINPQVNGINNYAALATSGLSIGAKEWLFRYTL